MPFFLYVANKGDSNVNAVDGNSAMFIARKPWLSVTPAAANDIGDTDALPVNDSANVIMLLGSYTQANYVSLPCRLVGAFRMRWSTSTDDWTIQALSAKDGIGEHAINATLNTTWTYPAGQNGAFASHYFTAIATNTAPVFSTMEYKYAYRKEGSVSCYVTLNGDGGTDGSGTGAVLLTTPIAISTDIPNCPIGPVSIKADGSVQLLGCLQRNSASDLAILVPTYAVGGELKNLLDSWTPNDYGNGDRTLRASFSYIAKEAAE
jgi:hypothetical protein